MAIFVIKRTYGCNHDWLCGWDEKWGTSCTGSKAKAMTFPSREDADAACRRANTTCCGYKGAPMPTGMVFEIVATEGMA